MLVKVVFTFIYIFQKQFDIIKQFEFIVKEGLKGWKIRRELKSYLQISGDTPLWMNSGEFFVLKNYFMFFHNVSFTSCEALGNLCAQNQNNELNLFCAPDIASKYLKVPIDSLVLETSATQQGLRPDKSIKPVLVRCMPITVFCQKHSHHCSTSSRSKSYRSSISLLTTAQL